MWFRRKERWPRVDLYSKGGPGDIKALSIPALEGLMAKADERGWSADGRPEWFRLHRDRFSQAALVIFGREGHSLYRCIATVILEDGSGGRFTLDIAIEDFNSLPDSIDSSTVAMAHRFLASFPMLELDQNQAELDNAEVWRRWGSSPT